MFVETARAKVNLNLHVGRLVEDPAHQYYGYHPISSLVAFADYGDELSCARTNKASLQISGLFAEGLVSTEDNLIMKAYRAVSEKTKIPPLGFSLTKNLPIASGIGGGSADAAAALRLMQNFVELPSETWADIALSLGADVPVCLSSKTCIMSGIGEQIELRPGLGPVSAVLINPGKTVSTGRVFKLFDEMKPDFKLQQPNYDDLQGGVLAGRNDLLMPAQEICSEIKELIVELIGSFGCEVSGMSGSGASCFGVFGNSERAKEAESSLRKTYPNWWVRAVTLGDPV